MFDTHAHLNFEAFENNLDEVIKKAKKSGVEYIVIPGSKIKSSKIAIEIAQKNSGIFAAVGIHPFHVYGHFKYKKDLEEDFKELEKLLEEKKVIAIGEVGLDRHIYKSKKYPDYQISEELVNLQKQVLIKQIRLAVQYKKSLIIHSRGTVEELLYILKENWTAELRGRAVFHFCEPDLRLLNFAKKHQIYIGVDGDVTYDKDKQEFVKKIPLELLVLETDSPYIIPEPLKSKGNKLNQPANLKIIAEKTAEVLGADLEEIKRITTENAQKLFL